MQNSDASPYRLQSVSQALVLLDLLVQRRGLRVREAARSLGVAPSTARRLLLTLVEEGYAAQDPLTKIYRPGLKVLSLQASAPWGGVLRAAGHEAMLRLRDALGESVSLSVLHGGEVVFIDGVDSLATLRAAPRVGARMPAYATAGGKVQLAQLSVDDLEGRYPQALPQLTPRTVADREELLMQLAQVRRRDFCISHGESTRGLSAVSVPLRPDGGHVAAAVSVVAPTERLQQHDPLLMLDPIRRAADRIEADVSAARLRERAASPSEKS